MQKEILKWFNKNSLEYVIFFENKILLFYTTSCLNWEGRHNQGTNWSQRMQHLSEIN